MMLLTESKHVKGSKERYLLEQNTSMRIFGVILFIKLQNDTYAKDKRRKTMKNETGS